MRCLVLALLAALTLAFAASSVSADGIVPIEAAYKGKTAQKLPVYFGVREGAVVNIRYTVKWGYCGKFMRHERQSVAPIDADGHFLYKESQSEIEGTFVEPGLVEGTATFLEHPLAGCPHKAVPFSASPR